MESRSTARLAPRFIRRHTDTEVYRRLVDHGQHPLAARVVAGRQLHRGVDPVVFLDASLKDLDHPGTLSDIDVAADRIAEAVVGHERIGLIGDYDADGQSFMAVTMTALIDGFGVDRAQIATFIGDRLTEGYGLSSGLCDRILASEPLPELCITGDCGSSDNPRIARLAAAGIECIVSDHHHFPDSGVPSAAMAVVSPIHPDGGFPDPYITGGVTGWCLMAMVRQKLIDRKHLDTDTPKLGGLIDYCAISTIADVVSMGSANNRALVKHGLALINRGSRPAWRAFLATIDGGPVKSSDIGFRLGPYLNADGRLADAFGSVSFLLSRDDAEARDQLDILVAQNEQRKALERALTKQATTWVRAHIQPADRAVVVHLDEGHPGVVGIVASRLKEQFGRPAVVLTASHRHPGQLTGSARGIDYHPFHCRDALQFVADRAPHLLPAFGGHQGAAGLSIPADGLTEFRALFDEACRTQLDGTHLGPVVITDGKLEGYLLDQALIETLESLEPFGRGFEAPCFELTAEIIDLRVIGADRNHLKLRLALDQQDRPIDAVWFHVRDRASDPLPVSTGRIIHCAGTPSINTYRGVSRPQFVIDAVMLPDESL